jgi:hypothetical protein
MNCRDLQDKVYEYVDGSLPDREQAEAKQHLETCDFCRHTVRELQSTEQSLSNCFRRSAESVTLSPNAQKRIMSAVEEKLNSPSPFLAGFRRPLAWLGSGVALLLLSAVLITEFPFGPRVSHPETARSLGGDSVVAISIRISYCDPIYTFSTDGSSVVDSLDCQLRVVEESLQLSSAQTPIGQERKSPL